jgi:hypothetical protein
MNCSNINSNYKSSASGIVPSRMVTSPDGQHLYSKDGKVLFYMREEYIGKGGYGSVYVYSGTSDGEVDRDMKFAIKTLNPVNFSRKKTFKSEELKRLQLIKAGVPLSMEQMESKVIDRSNIYWYKSARPEKYIALVEYLNVMREIELAMCINLFGLNPFGEFISDEGLQGKFKTKMYI